MLMIVTVLVVLLKTLKIKGFNHTDGYLTVTGYKRTDFIYFLLILTWGYIFFH